MRCLCATTTEELEAYREPWEALRTECGGSVYTSYDLAMLWLEVYDDFEPRVLVVEDHGEVVGIAPLALRRRSVAGIPVRTLSFIGDNTGGGRLGLTTFRALFRPGRTDVLDKIIEGIKKLDWNHLRAIHMEDVGPAHQLMAGIRSMWRCHEYPPDSTVMLTVPESGDIMAGFKKGMRRETQRRSRNLEREHQVVYRQITGEDIEAAVEVYARQHIERWRDRGGSLFQDPRNVRFLGQAMSGALANGYGYAYELLVDGEVAAQEFGFLEDHLSRAYMTGMNNAYARYSPGILLSVFILNSLRERGLTVMDVGVGESGYKADMGGVRMPLIGLGASRGTAFVLYTMANLLQAVPRDGSAKGDRPDAEGYIH